MAPRPSVAAEHARHRSRRRPVPAPAPPARERSAPRRNAGRAPPRAQAPATGGPCRPTARRSQLVVVEAEQRRFEHRRPGPGRPPAAGEERRARSGPAPRSARSAPADPRPRPGMPASFSARITAAKKRAPAHEDQHVAGVRSRWPLSRRPGSSARWSPAMRRGERARPASRLPARRAAVPGVGPRRRAASRPPRPRPGPASSTLALGGSARRDRRSTDSCVDLAREDRVDRGQHVLRRAERQRQLLAPERQFPPSLASPAPGARANSRLAC